MAADHREKVQVIEVDPNDRNREISDKYEISAWVGYDFPGRQGKYSEMRYHWYHFTGVDYNADNYKTAIYKIMGDQSDGWAEVGDVDSEKGNYDYLMGSDVDFDHPEVMEDVLNWGKWLANEIPIKGIRFDAVKHFSEDFLRQFIVQMDETFGKGWFFVGEFWKDSVYDMVSCIPKAMPKVPANTPGKRKYLNRMNRKFSLFDAPLVYNFSEISRGNSADLRRVFDGSLVQADPIAAVVSKIWVLLGHWCLTINRLWL